jgi:hypothetical protein
MLLWIIRIISSSSIALATAGRTNGFPLCTSVGEWKGQTQRGATVKWEFWYAGILELSQC